MAFEGQVVSSIPPEPAEFVLSALRLDPELPQLLSQVVGPLPLGVRTLPLGFGGFLPGPDGNALGIHPAKPSDVEVFIATIPQPQAQADFWKPISSRHGGVKPFRRGRFVDPIR